MLIILIVVAIRFFTFRPPVTQQENFTKLSIENSNDNQNSKPVKKRSLQSDRNFYANTEFADFFEDVPCKDTYLLYNYFSELKDNQGTRQETIRNFSIKLAKLGLFEKAIELANLIEEQSAYAKLVALLLKAGEVDKAIRIANSMRMYNFEFRKYYLESGINKHYENAIDHIVSYLTKIGELERAVEFAESVGDSMLSRIANFFESEKQKYFISDKAKSRALSTISNVLIKSGKTEEALKIANSINDFEIKVETLCNIASKIIELGQKSLGIEVFQSAIELIDKLDLELFKINNRSYQIMKLNKIAFELSKMGEMELSKQVFDKSVSAWEEHDLWINRIIALAIIKSGHYDWGIELTDSLDDIWVKRWIFKDSASALVKMNKHKEAEIFIKKAIENALDSPPEDPYTAGFCPTKAEVCWEYAKLLAEAKKTELSNQYFLDAITYFKKGNNRDELTDSEKEGIIKGFIWAGKIDWALELLDTINPEHNIDFAYSSIAYKFTRSGDIDRSLEYLDKMQDKKEKFYSLKWIAEYIIKHEDYSEFEKLFPNLLSCADEYTDEIERNEYFFIICQLLLAIPCEEHQKYIQQFISAYES